MTDLGNRLSRSTELVKSPCPRTRYAKFSVEFGEKSQKFFRLSRNLRAVSAFIPLVRHHIIAIRVVRLVLEIEMGIADRSDTCTNALEMYKCSRRTP